MRVFLTGATGLLGKGVASALVARGDQVIAVSRSPPPGAGGVTWVTGDPGAPGPWQRAAGGADAIVHLAGEPIASRRWSAAQKEKLVQSRVSSTRLVVEAMAQAPAPRAGVLVTASGAGYFGPRGEEDLSEDSTPGQDFLARLCVAWEAESRKAGAQGARACQLRFGAVLARDGGALARMLPAFRFFVGGPLGDPRKWFPWIHETDAVGLVLAALDGKLSGPVNAVSPGLARMGTFARQLGAALGRPAFLRVPEVALRLMLGELGAAIVPGQKIHPRAALSAGFRFAFESLDAALRDCVR